MRWLSTSSDAISSRPTTQAGATVEEVWFAGVHSNIGGGYDNSQLSNIALSWMMSKAVEAGLPTEDAYIEGWHNENSFAPTRDSHREFLAPLAGWVTTSRTVPSRE